MSGFAGALRSRMHFETFALKRRLNKTSAVSNCKFPDSLHSDLLDTVYGQSETGPEVFE